MSEIRGENKQPPTSDYSLSVQCREEAKAPVEYESSGGEIADFTLRAGGRKMKVVMLAQGDITSRIETCSPGRLSPDQWTKLCDVLLMAAHSMISMDHPEDGN